MADKIVAEYTVKVDKAIRDLEKLANKVDKVDDERKKTQDGFKSMSNQLSGGFKKLGGVIAGVFATQQLVSFGKEAVKLASQMEGVERAFKRIGGANSDNLLDGLRKATRGTVSDLQLMQKAVQASNFKIPLENLASLFKFAQARARETGESVEYLTNSIVLGIGRKSPLILDNLGISAVELRERLKGVGVEASSVGDIAKIIGDIAEEELAKMGDQADTTADKLEKINAALDNMKVVAGEALINLGTGLLYLLGQVDTGIESTDGLAKAAENLASIYNDDVSGAVDKMIQKNQELLANQIKIAELEETRSYQNSREAINNINEQIDKLEERNIFLKEYVTQLKAIYDASIKEDEVQKEVIKNLAYYNDLIKELRAEQADSNTTRERVRDLEDEINEAIRQRLILLGRLREVGGTTLEPIEPITEISPLKQAEELTEDLISEQYRRDEEIAAIKEQYRQSDLVAEEAYQQELTDKFFMYADAVSDLFTNLAQIQRNLNQEELDLLQERLEKGDITRDEYEQKRKSILQDQAESEKALAIFDATINGAAAVVSALNTDPTGVLAGIVGASVAAQIAAIASQPTPQFEEGGFVDSKGYISGRSHKTGGVLIEAEGGEYITSKKYANQNKHILEAINSGNWEKYKFENIISPAIEQVLEGGMDNIGSSIVLQNKFNDKNMLRAFDRNRSAARQDAQYIVSELTKNFKGRLRGGFA